MPRRFAWHPRKDDCTSCDDVFVRGRGGEWCSTLIITRLTAEVARPDARQDGVRCRRGCHEIRQRVPYLDDTPKPRSANNVAKTRQAQGIAMARKRGAPPQARRRFRQACRITPRIGLDAEKIAWRSTRRSWLSRNLPESRVPQLSRHT